MPTNRGYGPRLSPGPLVIEQHVVAPDSIAHGLLAEIGEFWRIFIKAAFDPYHPEQHYMRGPGPACAAKRRAAAK
ncbi:MAG TPA: hypothetical protein VF467_03405 [Afipia sp.]